MRLQFKTFSFVLILMVSMPLFARADSSADMRVYLDLNGGELLFYSPQDDSGQELFQNISGSQDVRLHIRATGILALLGATQEHSGLFAKNLDDAQLKLRPADSSNEPAVYLDYSQVGFNFSVPVIFDKGSWADFVAGQSVEFHASEKDSTAAFKSEFDFLMKDANSKIKNATTESCDNISLSKPLRARGKKDALILQLAEGESSCLVSVSVDTSN